jgi:uncharacterized protein YneF (UPF0154 family)
MKKAIMLILITVIFIVAMIGEYFFATYYYPEGCCSDAGS